ncbi:hypothetical protein HMJ29_01685 [Hymenobacter taeanensis]|uniref:Uncharacterized protein n=1 Tax=Hymenobacter taeanensis TaxID=2735321 RepID=A0A6M6BD96_9BACT|nr:MULTISPECIES: hypothetical protein [Hymenobacter]QJX45714.1 hypothetical protein HMJ29_01685 [Hymenobacter taeanensis]UOQ79554.1 hypothetical protein MUN83_11895 [Hymenobacter sp. 5414T-23]
MKRLFLALSIGLLGTIGFNSCNHPEQNPKPQSTLQQAYPVPTILHGATLNGIAVPDGTKTSVENNGKTVRLIYPAGIRFVTSQDYDTDPSANLLDDGGGSTYTCTGACTSGCDVFYVQGSFACSQCSNGSACTGKASLTVEPGGFIDTQAGISFIRDKAQLKELRSKNIQSPNDLFQFKYIQRAMRELNIKVHGVADPTKQIANHPNNYKHVVVNIFGALADYAVPNTYVISESKRLSTLGGSLSAKSTIPSSPSQYFLLADEESGFSCSCSSGGSGCTAESGIGYKKCNSGACVSCSMSVG